MKKIAITLATVLFTIVGVQAQNNVDVEKETVIKKVRTTDTYNQTVQVVEKVDKKVEVLQIPKDGKTNKTTNKVSVNMDEVNVVKNETKVDADKLIEDKNAKVITAANAQRELEKSTIQQKQKQQLKMAIYDANQRKLEMERAERKAVLSKEVGQTDAEAKKNSAEYQKAKNAYEIADNKAKKAEMLMQKM